MPKRVFIAEVDQPDHIKAFSDLAMNLGVLFKVEDPGSGKIDKQVTCKRCSTPGLGWAESKRPDAKRKFYLAMRDENGNVAPWKPHFCSNDLSQLAKAANQ